MDNLTNKMLIENINTSFLSIIVGIILIVLTFLVGFRLLNALSKMPKAMRKKNLELIYINLIKIVTSSYILGIIYYISLRGIK